MACLLGVVPTPQQFRRRRRDNLRQAGRALQDVATGVLAHLQHVLMYSTTRIPNPVAKRTRQVQDDVQDAMRKLHRPVTFADLAREWTGTDRNTYGAEMQKLAEKYAASFCREQARNSRYPTKSARGFAPGFRVGLAISTMSIGNSPISSFPTRPATSIRASWDGFMAAAPRSACWRKCWRPD